MRSVSATIALSFEHKDSCIKIEVGPVSKVLDSRKLCSESHSSLHNRKK